MKDKVLENNNIKIEIKQSNFRAVDQSSKVLYLDSRKAERRDLISRFLEEFKFVNETTFDEVKGYFTQIGGDCFSIEEPGDFE